MYSDEDKSSVRAGGWRDFKAMGGTIEVKSSLGIGTTIRLMWTLADPAERQGEK
ncbi:hypothetical protein [Cohnella soli]|uniref:Uncharacterized protein n=1 Tax=Cohnella soli TaxID=425005 RepID=A0ABW0HY08_9BACL